MKLRQVIFWVLFGVTVCLIHSCSFNAKDDNRVDHNEQYRVWKGTFLYWVGPYHETTDTTVVVDPIDLKETYLIVKTIIKDGEWQLKDDYHNLTYTTVLYKDDSLVSEQVEYEVADSLYLTKILDTLYLIKKW